MSKHKGHKGSTGATGPAEQPAPVRPSDDDPQARGDEARFEQEDVA